MDRTGIAFWDIRAAGWQVAPPLSPSSDDVAWYESKASELAQSLEGNLRHALLLGVTPPIAAMHWPNGTRLVAVDWSEVMFRHVWPKRGLPQGAAAVRGDWRELPLATGSMDFAISDGCYPALGSLQDAAHLNRELHRVLRPHGLFCLRCYCRPEKPRAVTHLFEDLVSGRMRNPGLFRWLLAVAVHGESQEGVSLHDVWKVWNERRPDPGALRDHCGWTDKALADMDFWGTADARFSFPTYDELARLAEPFFEIVTRDLPGYEMGERFPRLILRARERTRSSS
jgi:SAM-dependent methyltransferase